jgi:hypothetical protein
VKSAVRRAEIEVEAAGQWERRLQTFAGVLPSESWGRPVTNWVDAESNLHRAYSALTIARLAGTILLEFRGHQEKARIS